MAATAGLGCTLFAAMAALAQAVMVLLLVLVGIDRGLEILRAVLLSSCTCADRAAPVALSDLLLLLLLLLRLSS